MFIVTKKGNTMSDNPVMNTLLMEQVMTFIKDHPEKHNQKTWVGADYDPVTDEACGTTCCFAGHAMLLSGEYSVKNFGDKYDPDYGFIYSDTGEEFEDSERDVAQKLLGLNLMEAEHIFYSGVSNDIPLEIAFKDVMNGNFRKD